MSKRNSLGQSNTLFNYFQSPKGKPTPKKSEIDGCAIKSTRKETGNGTDDSKNKSLFKPRKSDNKSDKESDDDTEEEVVRKKRRRIIQPSSDSEGENESPNKQSKRELGTKKRRRIDSDNESDNDIASSGSSAKSFKDYTFQKTDKTNDTTTKTEESSKVKKPILPVQVIEELSDNSGGDWLHNRLEFLQPHKIRDIDKNRPNDPDYDSRTLFVPEDFLSKLTPAMRQWWILKRTHMDTVLFFKVGKFYELYHMDAVVGVQHLGFSYMKGEFAHSGFPETAYAKMAGALIEKGFKVARVEQTETPEMMNERCKSQKKPTKFDKVVRREICQISTKATCVYTAQMPDAANFLPCYMYAVCEKILPQGYVKFGVCFIDTSIGIFHLAEFDDDKHCSKILALFAEHPPGLILTERGGVKSHFAELLKANFKDIRQDVLASKSQFYSASTTLEKLSAECYFRDKNEKFHWPPIFKDIADDCLPKPEYELMLKSLGACMWYLKDSELDIQMFSMQKFEMYKPLEVNTKNTRLIRDYMVLDSTTIFNLSLLGTEGTLQKNLDHCQTSFGKRLLQQWICRPLYNIEKIEERQKAIKELCDNPGKLISAQDVLKKLPDLERQVAKIHTYGNKFCAQSHPDGRAIFYEAITYSKRKIQDLLKTLKGFDKCQDIPAIFIGCESRLLRKITQFSPGGMFLDLSETLQFFKEAFDQNEAEKEGKIIPKPGVEADYDKVQDEIAEINQQLNEYLEEQQRFFGCKVTYFGSDKKRFQLDVPENKSHKVTNEYSLEGSKKGAKPSMRYSTPTTRELLAAMLKAESERAKIIQDLNRRIFEKFSERYEQWEQVTHCLTILDVLCSLAEYARKYPHDICVPKILSPGEKAKIIIENGRHPCIVNIDNYVPNDTNMGVEGHASILIITGPNMGGKSTLMRQVAVLSVMAQIGCMVPASLCEITLIDRIFTRLGAHDDIVKGQSTFFVELSEAAAILQHATTDSLVLLDELGRGTSTHDGNAIATAYVKKLTEINCRTMFSTHYHTLVDEFIGRDDIQLGHMACMVENDEDPSEESVTFLYKMAEGRCPKSFGFNAARLAGMKHSIVARGREFARQLEQESKNRDIFKSLFASSSSVNKHALVNMLAELKM